MRLAALAALLIFAAVLCIPGSECRDDLDCDFGCFCSDDGYCEND